MKLQYAPDETDATKPKLGFRKTNHTIVAGFVLTDGRLLPAIIYPRYRSKYNPHQGLRERVRRLKQQPLSTVDHTL